MGIQARGQGVGSDDPAEGLDTITIAGSARTAEAAREALTGRTKGRVRRLLPFLGPAFIAAVAYVDPGNFATNIQGGAQFGYLLLWVIVASNLMAMLIQSLSAKLGIATGRNLRELPDDLVARMREAMEMQVDFDEELKGDVAL